MSAERMSCLECLMCEKGYDYCVPREELYMEVLDVDYKQWKCC